MEWVFDFNWVKELENETACDSNFDPSSIVDPFESLASLFAFHLSARSNSKIAWKRLPDDSAIEISIWSGQIDGRTGWTVQYSI